METIITLTVINIDHLARGRDFGKVGLQTHYKRKKKSIHENETHIVNIQVFIITALAVRIVGGDVKLMTCRYIDL